MDAGLRRTIASNSHWLLERRASLRASTCPASVFGVRQIAASIGSISATRMLSLRPLEEKEEDADNEARCPSDERSRPCPNDFSLEISSAIKRMKSNAEESDGHVAKSTVFCRDRM